MCGVWGRTRFKEKVQLSELMFPVQRLSHRGPDGYGWFADDRMALVHTRLSIIDLSGGSQPLVSFDDRWIGIVNGELYDYDQIRDRLIAEGVRFRTHSDSEVLLNLFVKHGTRALEKVSGEFAFIFYDRQAKKICFGRDPMGVKPLFFEKRADSFTLASEMKALQNEAPVFDQTYVNTFLAHTMVPPGTALQGVEHVWPGRVYTLDLDTKALTWEAYAKIPLFQERTLKGQEAQDAIEESLKASVRRRLKADVEVGTYLSGGIDSALVASLIAESGARPHAFTVGFADRDFDESHLAAKIAQDLGLRHSIVQLTSKNFMDSLYKSIVAFENPITNPHGAAKNLLSSLATQHVRVVLSGEGSDEWFGGYAYLRIKKLKDFAARHPRLSGRALEIFSERESAMNLNHLDGRSAAFDALAAKHFQGIAPAIFGRLVKRRWYNHITGGNLDTLIDGHSAALAKLLREENPSGRVNDWDLNSWLGIRTDLLHYILANVGDRQEMSHSLEGRTPFMDPQVLEVAGRVRETDLIRGLREKYALRKVGAKYLHREHSRRGKRPFFAPIKYLYLRENRDAVESYIRKAEASTPWLNWHLINHILNSKRRTTNMAIEGNIVSMRLTLFSLGVLSERLRGDGSVLAPRGFTLPRQPEDLLPYRKQVG